MNKKIGYESPAVFVYLREGADVICSSMSSNNLEWDMK